MRVTNADLDVIIDNIEKKGEDASELKTLRDSSTRNSRQAGNDFVDDDEHVRHLVEQSPVENGNNLECQVCHELCTELISGVCKKCFRGWALSTKKK